MSEPFPLVVKENKGITTYGCTRAGTHQAHKSKRCDSRRRAIGGTATNKRTDTLVVSGAWEIDCAVAVK